MRNYPLPFIPRSIAGQVVLLVVVSVVFFHCAMTSATMLVRPKEEEPSEGMLTAFGLVSLVHVLDSLPPGSRPAAVAAVSRSYPHLQPRLRQPNEVPLYAVDNRQFPLLRQTLNPELRIFSLNDQPKTVASSERPIAVQLRDGSIVTAILSPMLPRGPRLSGLVLGTVLFIILNLALLLWWATRGLTAPLTHFAHAAESFSLDHDPALLPENEGPREVRTVSRALNRMRARIRRMAEERTRMLAAVSHDLRTPITRLRLRSEFIKERTIREQMLRDLDQMSTMVHAALSYLRDGEKLQGGSLIEFSSVIKTICNQFADMGANISYKGPNQLLVRGRSDELQRAITNLVENSVRFGASTTVQVRIVSETSLEIDIMDDGPGISDAEKNAMLEPFRRGDDARNMDDMSGFGLGLSIARTIAEAHNGELLLLDRKPSGLIARLRLPIRVDAQQSTKIGARVGLA
jgi:signal transduction histidine kinase